MAATQTHYTPFSTLRFRLRQVVLKMCDFGTGRDQTVRRSLSLSPSQSRYFEKGHGEVLHSRIKFCIRVTASQLVYLMD